MEHFDHITEICSHYGIPKGNLLVVDDVADAAVALGWEARGLDRNHTRMAKIKCDLSPPKILLKRCIDWSIATQMTRMFPLTEEQRRRRVDEGLDRKWFMTHLVLHEVAHWKLRHHEANTDPATDAYEARLLKELEADCWAISEIENNKYA
ncbi:hypothetical protein ESB00_04395 [Oleiharenicola lentus]|uniref:Uncharacterized protein n=1 Tax=Oleiharenicola lentus TaxID=2508720 RepID=A0A4Q1C881_9BACT|nr:hypothetical protein [Oleiharenicola lentus]RXK55144.1 hypothetical protein ESB00_04395 [Oleiharenicola lentus]